MAALFTPEGEKTRKAQASGSTNGNGVNAAGFRVPSSQAISEGGKTGDSLGNPNTPGYAPLPLNKKDAVPQEITEHAAKNEANTFETPSFGPETIRLNSGFEKLLFAQAKLCEKAEAVFTKLGAPMRYRSQKKGKLLSGKSRGCIVDVSPEGETDLAAPPKKEDAA